VLSLAKEPRTVGAGEYTGLWPRGSDPYSASLDLAFLPSHSLISSGSFKADSIQSYVEGQFTPLSKPFKTKAASEKARLKLPERERRSVAVGVIRIKK
jgi:hypothetical protein